MRHRVLITGATGFIGSVLTEYLEAQERYELFGTYLSAPPIVSGKRHLYACDVTDYFRLRHVMEEVQPHYVYHLAAQSYPELSWTAPTTTILTNAVGTVNVLEAVRTMNPDAAVLVACSSAEYGVQPEQTSVLSESSNLNPVSPYGLSKLYQDLLAQQFHSRYALRALRVRIFNCTGPGKLGDVCADFASQIAKIEKRQLPPEIRVGNLSPRRDLSDVRDVVRALHMVLERGRAGDVYNICSGQAVGIEELLRMLLSLSSRPEIAIRVDEGLCRPIDEPVIWGSSKKLQDELGWVPRINLRTTLKDILEWWRGK